MARRARLDAPQPPAGPAIKAKSIKGGKFMPKAKRTVGQKAMSNYKAGFKGGGSTRVKSAASSVVPGNPTTTRRAVRTAIKAGIRAKRPNLSAQKVKGRAAKQTRAFMRQTKK